MNYKHGCRHTKTYNCWRMMKKRCQNPRYHLYFDYGGRGIRVCPRWENFQVFLEDMGHAPPGDTSIERIDNNGNYEPSNCRWATRPEQNRNKRNSALFEVNGSVKCVVDWVKEAGLVERSAYRYFHQDPERLRNLIEERL